MLTRTVTETALLLDVLSGYEAGDATWAPKPAEPYTLAMRRDPGRLRVAMTLENAVGADVDPEVVRGLHDVADALTALGHEVVEDAPALPGPDSLDIFLDVFGPMVAVGIGYGETLAGRPPTEDEIEPLSRAVLEHARTLSSTAYLTAVAQLQAARAPHGRVLRRLRPAADPGPRHPAAADRRAARLRRAPAGRPAALRPLRALHRAVQRHRPARAVAAGRLR